ncbi:HEXXH motif domain-containing protein [Cryptosporangium phraense]|uniref:HEXXH motif domain-containing protein n=1 Tax=Cryptosporangium phraense TaxID=2593070 RepID=A0A545AZA6_9ACTN|nr:HEXXH motif domain-containing protein [Cryptosporangium phraense]TQS46628.1 hypothetical protein FL583_04410 [Cryptosporangium phraense]
MSAPTRPAPADGLATALADGSEPAATVNRLYSGQLRLRTGRLRALVARAVALDPDGARDAFLEESYAALRELQQTHPRVVTALLLYPHVGAWLAESLRRLDPGRPSDETPEAQLGYLSALVAAAVLRADAELSVPLAIEEPGRVVLPAVGTCLLPAGTASAWRLAGRRITDGQHEVALPADLSAETDEWKPVRRLRSDHGSPIDVAFDEQDPARSCGPTLTLAPRADAAEWEAWQQAFDEAWAMLLAEQPGYAEEIRAGLQCLVPLASLGGGRSSSLTVGDAFGSVVTTPPANGGALALTLIHETQHGKLSALLDLEPLYRADSDDRFYAPWRDDPRPFGAVLQGVYAHLGVANFWRVHRWAADGDDATLAHMEFTRWRQQTEEAAAELARADVVTESGLAFLDVISGRLAEWGTEPVPGSADELAAAARFEHRIGWRLRNLELDAARLADAIRREPITPLPEPVAATAKQSGPTGVWSARLRLMYAGVTQPDLYERLRSGEQALDVEASDADLACLVGDYATAEPAYEAQIADGGSWEAWVGLVHCYPQTRPGPAAEFFRARPEVVASVYEELAGQLPPYEVARRLAVLLP